jgi:hypothetical protein
MLIDSLSVLNQYADASNGINWTSIQDSVKHAQNRYLRPILGTDFINELIAINTPNAVQSELIEALRRSLASLSFYLFVPISDVMITDGGVRRGNSTDMPTAFRYQVDDARKAYLDRGFEYLEDAIALLESNLYDFGTWTASDEYLTYKQLFIRTGSEFAKLHSGIRYPRRMFMLLRSSIYNVQELSLPDILGDEVYTEIASALDSTAQVPETIVKLVDYVKHGMAHLSLAKGLPNLIALLDDHSLSILTNSSDSGHAQSKNKAADPHHISLLMESEEKTAQAWFDKAVAESKKIASTTLFPQLYQTINTTQQDTLKAYKSFGVFGI